MSLLTTGSSARPPGPGNRRDPTAGLISGQRRIGEKIIEAALVGAAVLSVLITVGIVVSLFAPLGTFFSHVNPVEFLTGTEWTASFGNKSSWDDKAWGVLPLVVATMVTTVIALVVAVPLGLGSAMFLSEYATARIRRLLKPMLEVLAGIPTVVYGAIALTVITPLMKPIFGIPGIYNMLAPGVVMGFMIIPTVASLSEDAMSAVPDALRHGSYALGANRMKTTVRVVFPAALSGIMAAVVLAISRAVGETMIMAVAVGNRAALTFDPREGAQTMTAFIAQIAGGDAPQGSPVYYSLFAVGALLFVLTLIINLVSIQLVRKFRQVY